MNVNIKSEILKESQKISDLKPKFYFIKKIELKYL
jgi:hypothetical protein